jgi:aminoglycoside phosphotransferase (APT) family kinase protein
VVGPDGLVGVLDWEFAHLENPARELAWPLVRAWRFGVDSRRLGGLGEVGPYLERYNELTGRDVTEAELAAWELAGNVSWAIGCLTQSRRHLSGLDRSVEYAVLGRLAAEVEYEILHLLEHAA